jgi:hypothetical protein
VRWGAWTLDEPQAGALGEVHVELENAGTVPWLDGIRLAYHWLDDRGNPIVWDGIRTRLPHLAPGERASVRAGVRAPIPPGRYRLALDLVAEHRAWFSELGSEPLSADVDVGNRTGTPFAMLPDWAEPAPDWAERVAAAHAEGYAVVAGAVEWDRGLLHPRPRALDPYRPGSGRIPGFPHPLVFPSVLDGVSVDELTVEGLPAVAAPPDEPWLYDGRIVVTARRRSGRRSARRRARPAQAPQPPRPRGR